MAFDSTLAHLSRFFRSPDHAKRIDLDPASDSADGGAANPPGCAGPSGPSLLGQGFAGPYEDFGALQASEPLAASAPHAAVWQTHVGANKKGLKFDLIWDASVKHAPKAFRTAVIDAAAYYTRMFKNDETVKVKVGYGEVHGEKIPANDVASSIGNSYYNFTYSNVDYYLTKDAGWSNEQRIADSWLPSPSNAGLYSDYYYRVTYAQAQAWGVKAPANSVDGFLGLSSSLNYDYNPKGPIGAHQYDAIGAIEHELTEIMGRVGSCLTLRSPSNQALFTPLDLFRYSGYDEREANDGAGYFSVNNGLTDLGTYNDAAINGGDVADWNPPIIGDSYGSGHPGHRGYVSAVDLVEDSVLGYHLTAAGLKATGTLYPVT